MAPSILSNTPLIFSEVKEQVDKNNNIIDDSNLNVSLPKRIQNVNRKGFTLGFFSEIHSIHFSNCVSFSQMQIEPYFQTKFADIVWRNVVAMIFLHLSAIYGLYMVLTLQLKLNTFLLCKFNTWQKYCWKVRHELSFKNYRILSLQFTRMEYLVVLV